MDSEPEDFRSVLYTVDREGRRRWQYVHVVVGFWRRWRRRLAWILIAFYVALPFLHIGGERVLHIDIPQRHYVILGHVFWPQDALFLLLLALLGVIGTLLAVSLFGRVFCGWFCPHNVFLEFVFRPIEGWLEGSAPRRKRQDQHPLTAGLAARKGLKYLLYLTISWILANTFIALFLSGEAHAQDFIAGILVDPAEHPAAFIAWLIAMGLILFNFAWFREQTCTIVCPYGRLQAVMLDRDTLTVAYDPARGEPRGPKKPDQEGDCIDCGLCQVVCPTGIDIRNGNQLECIHCAACIDACDQVMHKTGRDPGLIRYTSENALAGGRLQFLRPRGVLYAVVFSALIITGTVLAVQRPAVQVQLLRERGEAELTTNRSGPVIRKNFRISLINKTMAPLDVALATGDAQARLISPNADFRLPAATRTEAPLFIEVAPEDFTGRHLVVPLEISYRGQVQERIPLILRHP